MKTIHYFLLFALSAVLLQSCIADEPLNAECDIEHISLSFDDPDLVLYSDNDAAKDVLIGSNTIRFVARVNSDLTNLLLPVNVNVTNGATVQLHNGTEWEMFVNGTAVDFSNEQVRQFRVISQDGCWHRDYNVVVERDVLTGGDMFFDFEDYRLDATGKFYEWDVTDERARNVFDDGMWKNGNPGYKLSRSSAKPDEYPSTPVFGGGPDGSTCVCLETKSTGAFGNMVNMRFASGSMFNGTFDVTYALKDAMKATCFGSPFKHRPKEMRVWLRFEGAEGFMDRMANPIPNVVDEPDCYVVFYRNQDENGNRIKLEGDNILSSDLIVALARLPHHYNEDGSDCLSNDPIHGLTAQWQEVLLTLDYRSEVDADLLANNGYSLAIGFASSWQGARFMGAVGNRLFIDNLQLTCYDDDNDDTNE